MSGTLSRPALPPRKNRVLVRDPSSRARAGCGLLLALAAVSCSDPPARPSVAVHGGPDHADASATAPDAAGAALPDAAATTRQPEPRWPQAEVELRAPYKQPSPPTTLVLTPSPRQLDLHMNVDTTASFAEEIDTLQRELSRNIIPQLRRRIDDASFGVSRFADFPVTPFGSVGADHAYVLLTPITDSLSRVIAGVGRLDQPLGRGGDAAEAGAESLYQIATGAGLRSKNQQLIAAWDGVAASGGGTLGGVGFRSQALRVLVHVTDALSHKPEDYASEGLTGTHDMAQAIEALNALHVHTIAILSTACPRTECTFDPGSDRLHSELAALALGTGSSMPATRDGCATGIDGVNVPAQNGVCPLLFEVHADGSGLAGTVVDAVLGLLTSVRYDEVHAEVGDDPLGFVRRIEIAPVSQAENVAAPETADRLPLNAPDGAKDTYLHVLQQHRLGFKVTLQNDRIVPGDIDQHYRASIRMFGDGTLLEEHFLRVLIPASVDLDAGL